MPVDRRKDIERREHIDDLDSLEHDPLFAEIDAPATKGDLLHVLKQGAGAYAKGFRALTGEQTKRYRVVRWNSKGLVAEALVIAFMAAQIWGVPAVYDGLKQQNAARVRDINAERQRNTRETCEASTRRHDRTVRLLRSRIPAGARRDVTMALVDTLAPRTPARPGGMTCDQISKQKVRDR